MEKTSPDSTNVYRIDPNKLNESINSENMGGRNGNFILRSGKHRSILAKLLNKDKIPIRLKYRQRKWQKKRIEFLKKDNKSSNHPDLKNFQQSFSILKLVFYYLRKPLK